MYLRLKKTFRLLACDGRYELFNNATVDEYALDEDQYALLLNIDGTKTLSTILEQYNPTSHDAVYGLLEELKEIGAIEQLSFPEQRIFPMDYPSPYLEAVLWDITSLCDLKCTHCYVSEYFEGAKGADLSTDEALQVIEEMSLMNIRDVSLTGGEPFQRGDFRILLKSIVDHGIRVASLFTNGVDVSNDDVNYFIDEVKLSRRCRIRISLDGMNPESNAVLRGRSKEAQDTFDKTLGTIRKFVDTGFLVSVGTSIHHLNVQQLTQMYSFVKDLGIHEWRVAVPKPIGRYKSTQLSIGPTWEDVLSAYRKLIDSHLENCTKTTDGVTYPLKLDIEQTFRTELIEKTLNTFQPSDIVCFYHKNRCSVKANGDVTPCGYFDNIITGNVRLSGGLRRAWESEKMQKIKQMRIQDITECKQCSLLKTCGTGCRAIANKINGSLHSVDPYACRTAPLLENYIDDAIKKRGLSMTFSGGCEEYSIMESSPL